MIINQPPIGMPANYSPLQALRSAAIGAMGRLQGPMHLMPPPPSPQLQAIQGVHIPPTPPSVATGAIDHGLVPPPPGPQVPPAVGVEAANAMASLPVAPPLLPGAPAGMPMTTAPAIGNTVGLTDPAHIGPMSVAVASAAPGNPRLAAIARLHDILAARQAQQDAITTAVHGAQPENPRLIAALAAELESHVDPRARLMQLASQLMPYRHLLHGQGPQEPYLQVGGPQPQPQVMAGPGGPAPGGTAQVQPPIPVDGVLHPNIYFHPRPS